MERILKEAENSASFSVPILSARRADGEKRSGYFVKSFSSAYNGTVENDFAKSK